MKAWWYGGKNWGDILTPVLIERLAGVTPARALATGTTFVVGSILHRVRAGSAVWGTGAISSTHVPNPLPARITFHAVRGPETRKVLLSRGAQVPDVYGDPALLIPHLYPDRGQPRWKIGFIPHYNDRELLRLPDDPSLHVIDIEAPFEQVIWETMACESIVASSLHGVILGHAYGRRTAWMQMDGGARLVGKGFKFGDYFRSVGVPTVVNPVKGGEMVKVENLRWLDPINIDLQKLLDACPFKRPEIRTLADIPKA